MLAIIILISLVLMGIGLISYFYGNNKNPYGDRLKDIDNHKISEGIASDIKVFMKKMLVMLELK